jgi:hypothetical protein
MGNAIETNARVWGNTMGSAFEDLGIPGGGMMTSDNDVRCMLVGRPFAGHVTLASTIIGTVPWMEARERAAQEEEDYDPRRHGMVRAHTEEGGVMGRDCGCGCGLNFGRGLWW